MFNYLQQELLRFSRQSIIKFSQRCAQRVAPLRSDSPHMERSTPRRRGLGRRQIHGGCQLQCLGDNGMRSYRTR